MSGRNPPSYCTLTLIAMQGHQQKGRQNNTSSNNKDKSNTIIETSTAEDHDDENLHNPSTRPRYSHGFLCSGCSGVLLRSPCVSTSFDAINDMFFVVVSQNLLTLPVARVFVRYALPLDPFLFCINLLLRNRRTKLVGGLLHLFR